MEILDIEKGYELELGGEATSVFATLCNASRQTKQKNAQITLVLPDDWAAEIMQHSLSGRNARFKRAEHNYLLLRVPLTNGQEGEK